jgi:hypothetical protein
MFRRSAIAVFILLLCWTASATSDAQEHTPSRRTQGVPFSFMGTDLSRVWQLRSLFFSQGIQETTRVLRMRYRSLAQMMNPPVQRRRILPRCNRTGREHMYSPSW